MASTYSSNLKIELMGTGENSGTWGNITNTNLGTAFEQAVVGLGNPDYLSDANLTITITNSNAAQAARALVLNVTSSFGSLSTTRELVVPTIQKQYIVQNNTTGGQSITVKTSAGTGITVPNGRKAHLYVDGTNVIQMFDFVDINGGTIDGTAIGGAAAAAAAFTTLTASGATTLNGAVALGDAGADLITVPGTINSNLLFTDATYDIGASGATRPRDMFLSRNLTVGGTLTLAGGVNLNGNVTVGDAATDTLTINSTITSNLIFTDNTYDIGASGATRPRNLFLAGNATIGGTQTLTGALTVDSTTDSSSITTGSIQTDGGLGVAKALFVGTTANIAGNVTLDGGTANGVAYLNGSKVLTTGSALTFDGTDVRMPNGGSILVGASASGASLIAINGTADAQRIVLGTSGTDAVINATRTSGTSPNLIFQQESAELMRLTSTGLGIGTSSPTAKIHAFRSSGSSDGGATNSMLFLESGGSNANLIKFNGVAATEIAFGRATGSDSFYWGAIAGPTEWMRLTSTGLGIGTSSPSEKLTVAGNIRLNGNQAVIFQQDSGVAVGAVSFRNGSGVQKAAVASYYNVADEGAIEFVGPTNGTNMILNSSGNLGLGVTPSAWVGNTAAQIGPLGAIASSTSTPVAISANAYSTSAGWAARYITSSTASLYLQLTGQHQWFTAPSGTAGDAISFSQVMTLDASGNLLIGVTAAAGNRFYVRTATETANAIYSDNGVNSGFIVRYTPNTTLIGNDFNNPLAFVTNNTERARIDSSGNLLVGTTSAPVVADIEKIGRASC
jgi:hypothetical protein